MSECCEVVAVSDGISYELEQLSKWEDRMTNAFCDNNLRWMIVKGVSSAWDLFSV